jgi:hypothetical protein
VKGVMEADGFFVHNEVDHFVLHGTAPLVPVEVKWIKSLELHLMLDLGDGTVSARLRPNL